MKPLDLSNLPPATFLADTSANRSRSFVATAYVVATLAFVALSQAAPNATIQMAYYVALASIVLGAVHFGSRHYQPRLRSSRLGGKSPFRGDRRRAGKDLSSEHLFRSAFDHAAGMAIAAPTGRWLRVNPAICHALGYEQDELLARSFQDLLHPDDLGVVLIHLDKLNNGSSQSSQLEQRYIHNLGHTVWMLVTISLIRGVQHEPLYLVCQFQDITRRKEAEDRLVHDVFHDALTGLPNRALFMDRLRLTMERARRRKDRIFAVMFLDLDDFKTVNDSMGHMVGDQLLMEVARRLKSCLRTTDTVARLGGDEFTILLEDLSCESESLRIVERFQRELARHFVFGNTELSATASIGVACNASGHYESADEILRDADAAMYRAKTAGKATYEMVDPALLHPSKRLSKLSNDLDKAIERRELELAYQPIVCLESGTLLGVEALVRWNHPQQGAISPSEFIPMAENSGSIVAVGKWVLREACAQLKNWETEFPFCRSLTVNANLSITHLMEPGLVDDIVEVLQATSLEPRRLKLELTESLLMQNVAAATLVLKQLQALGVEVSIDDFGTGYSSLSYLHQLPVSSVKIDSSFVKGMMENSDHGEIIKSIVTMAKSLRMKVIAEGVETLEQLTQLRRLKCDAAQGFLFSKAAPAHGIEGLIALQDHWRTIIAALDTTCFSSAGHIDHFRQMPPSNRHVQRLRAV